MNEGRGGSCRIRNLSATEIFSPLVVEQMCAVSDWRALSQSDNRSPGESESRVSPRVEQLARGERERGVRRESMCEMMEMTVGISPVSRATRNCG